MTHRTRTLSITLALALIAVAGAGCKKDKKGGTAADPAPAPASGGATAAKPAGGGGGAAPAAAGGCPAGLTNPDNIGMCIKLPDGFKQNNDIVGHAGNEKAVGFVADGDAQVHIIVGEYDSMFWDDHMKSFLEGGGFGGKLKDQAKVGTDGITATFTADEGTMERTMRITKVHNDTIEAECWAEKNSMSTVGPALADVLAVCQNAVLAK